MRNLRLYNTDAAFKTHEQAAGGDGNATVTVVPGVSMSKDIRKRYFNPHDGSIAVYTLAAKYSLNGDEFSPHDVPSQVKVKYVTGTTSQVNVKTPSVGGIYSPVTPFTTATVPTDTAVTFEYEINKKKLNEEYLTFQIISGGTIWWRVDDGNMSYQRRLYYSKNGGEWTEIISNTAATGASISVNAGDIVRFRGGHNYYYQGNHVNCFSSSTETLRFNVYGNIMSLYRFNTYEEMKNSKTLDTANTFYGLFSGCTSLVDSSNLILPATALSQGCYQRMFINCTNLISAPELPAKSLASSCYYGMFEGCTSLIVAPELPATKIASYCYREMFSACTNLTTPPPIIPATRAEMDCCSHMFERCTSLTSAPELPATIMAAACYDGMFMYCSSLKTPPELPATYLGDTCYRNMFYFCTGLTSAPELPATNLVGHCYDNMFFNCGKINNIKALFTTKPSDFYTENWLYGVSSTGTFYKNPSATWNSSITRGFSTVPVNWTIQNAVI